RRHPIGERVLGLFDAPFLWTTRRWMRPRRSVTASSTRSGSLGWGRVRPRGSGGGTGAPGMSALGRTARGSAGDVREPREHFGGGERRRGRLVPLVLHGAGKAGPIPCLLVGVAGQESESDGDAVVEGHPIQPVGRRGADVVEVRGAAANHDAEGDHGLVAAGEAVRDHGQLEGAGHAHQGRRVDAGLGAGAQGAGDQAVHHLLVPGRGDDRDAGAGAGGDLGGGGAVAAHEVPPGVVPGVVVGSSAGSPVRWWPSRSRLVVRYARFSGVGWASRSRTRCTRVPPARRASAFSGLWVSRSIAVTPRCSRIRGTAAKLRSSTGSPRSRFASTVSRPASCRA